MRVERVIWAQDGWGTRSVTARWTMRRAWQPDTPAAYVKAGTLTCVLPDGQWPRLTLWALFPGRKLMPARTRVFIDALVSPFGQPVKS